MKSMNEHLEELFTKRLEQLKHDKSVVRGKVGVTSDFLDDKDGRWLIVVIAGSISATCEFIMETILDFSHYPDWFDFVDECQHIRKEQKVRISASLFNFAIQSEISYRDNEQGLVVTVVEGALKGCHGTVTVEDGCLDRSSVSIAACIKRERFPVPDFLIRWGARWFLGRGAQRAATSIERLNK